MENYELIVPVKASDFQSLALSLPYIHKNLMPSRITIITKEGAGIDCGCECRRLDEDRLLDGLCPGGLTLSRIKLLLKRRIGDDQRAGWFFQQFLKMGFALRPDCPQKYLIWDADTIPLRPIQFERNRKCVFYQTFECNVAYFLTLRNLLFHDKRFISSLRVKGSPFSFISESMLVYRDVMRELIAKIESLTPGVPFFEIVLSVVDSRSLPFSGFSEFETYGNYYLQRFSENACILDRTLRRFRYGKIFVGEHPTPKQVESLANVLDVVSFETGNPFGPLFPTSISMGVVQRMFLCFYWSVRKIIWLKNIIRLMCLLLFSKTARKFN